MQPEKMPSSYNTISSSSAPSFLLSAASAPGANNFNREQTARMMIQQPNSVAPPTPLPLKKRRNQPGNQNPDDEVIALSPNTITTTNRFICKVCNNGFQREQNLQLHLRGHNLPWKLKTKSNKEVKRKVYICPEPTCVHHNPSRALGDLTGIKKHYYRKHLEKIWNCEKCPKRYAVQSDLKAHSKICGTKQCRCDHCDTIFSRRDHYNSHKALCVTLTQESTKNSTVNFTAMAEAATGGDGGRHDFYDGPLSGFSHNHLGNDANSNFTPLVAGYNQNHPSSDKLEDLVLHSTNPNPVPNNFLMHCCPSNQGFLAHNNQSLMNQHGLMSLGDDIINNNNNNNNKFNSGYFPYNTNNSYQTSVPSLNANGVDNNEPSGFQRRFPSSSLSSGVVNDYGTSDTGNFQGLVNSLPVITNHQSRSEGRIFDSYFGSNLSIEGSNRSTFDFLGVNGEFVSNANGRGGRGATPLDGDKKFMHPNNPFGQG